MRILVGVDIEEKYARAIALLGRLNFSNTQWRLVHCRPSLNPNPMALHLESDEALNLMNPEWADARAVLESAKALVPSVSSACTSVVEASPPEGLLGLAEESRADLIAIGSNESGRLGSVILGSTSRALAIGSEVSFLVGRGTVAKEGPVRAVFATDHSSYVGLCVDQLLEWSPRGLEEITFVTATEMLELSDTVQYMTLLDQATQMGLTLSEYLEQSGQALVRKANEAGIKASYEPRMGFVGQAVESAMRDHKADMLILGAQGHGFLERLLIGSVALDLVVSAPYSTMVVRVKPEL